MWALAAEALACYLLEAQFHDAADKFLRLVDKDIVGVLERREPKPVVDKVGPFLLDAWLFAKQARLKAEVLERLVGAN